MTNTTGPGSDEAIVKQALEFVGELRVEEAIALTAEDLLLELPCRHDGGPTTMRGEPARRFIRAMPRLFRKLDFTELTVHGKGADGVVSVEYRSNGITQGGEPYPNVYAAFFEVRDGKIVRWREYFDPVVVAKAFKMA